MRLPVVMRQHVMHGVDARKVICIQYILAAGTGFGLLANNVLKSVYDGVQDVDHLDVQPLAGGVQLQPPRPVDQGGQHWTGFGLDAFQHAVQLKAGTHQTPPMMEDVRLFELHSRSPGNGVQRLPGGIRHQVQIDTVCLRGRFHAVSIQTRQVSGEWYPFSDEWSG